MQTDMRFYFVAPLVIVVTLFYSVVAVATRPFDRSNKAFHYLMRSWCKGLLALFGIKVVSTGTENLSEERQHIFVSNHSSHLDILALGATIPNGALFVYKEELAKVPIWGWSLRLSPFIMVRRSDARLAMESIRVAAEEIKNKGESVLIFPEGTRSKDGKVAAFKRGGFLLATISGAPIVPTVVTGSFELMNRGSIVVKKGTILVQFSAPIFLPEEVDRALEKKIQQEVHARIKRLVDQE